MDMCLPLSRQPNKQNNIICKENFFVGFGSLELRVKKAESKQERVNSYLKH